jgi:hypothetical protein
VSVEFTGLPQDEEITLSEADTPLSWADDTALTVSIGETGTFAGYRWALDGMILDGETGNTITLKVGNMAAKRHVLTVFVTKIENGAAVEYTKRVTFTVAW